MHRGRAEKHPWPVILAALLFGSCQSSTYKDTEMVIYLGSSSPAAELSRTEAPTATPVPTPITELSLTKVPVQADLRAQLEKSPSPTPVAVNPRVLLGEVWVQIQYLLDGKYIQAEDLVIFGLDKALDEAQIKQLPPNVWLPKLEQLRTDLEAFEPNSGFVVKRYEKILGKLLSSELSHDLVSSYQDRLANLMGSLESKSLTDVNKGLHDIEEEIKLMKKP